MKKNIIYLTPFLLIIFSCTTGPSVKKGIYLQSNQKVHFSNSGVISTGHPLATEAGVKMLSLGGNAIDAAVAAAFTLSVVEPSMSGIGGRAQILIYSPDSGFHGIDATTAAPSDYGLIQHQKNVMDIPVLEYLA